MSNAVFLRPDENGNWGQIGTDPTSNMSEQLVFQSGATALGDGTVQDVSGYTTLRFYFTFTGTATVTVEASGDGTAWYARIAYNGTSTGITANTTASFSTAGFKFFRARVSSYTSGSVTVYAYATVSTVTQEIAASSYGAVDTNNVNGTLLGVGAYSLLFDGTNWARHRGVQAAIDGNNGTGVASNGLYAFNGTGWDRVRTVTAGDGLGTGLLAQGGYVWDSTGLVWNRNRSANGVGDATTGTTMSAQSMMAFNGTTWDRVRNVVSSGDGSGAGMLANGDYGYNGATWDRQRVGKVYKYIEYLNLPTSTSATVWTPTGGKKFRLMGVSISSSASVHLHLRDAGTSTAIIHTVRPLATTVTFDWGNGYLSSNVNNVLEIRNESGTTTNVWVTAWGTEE